MLGGYAAWLALLTAAYYGFPSLRVEAWGLIGLSGVIAIAAGVIINRPSRKAPWLLLAAALASFVTGQVSFLAAQFAGVELPFPSFADVLYLATYPLYAAGLLIFIWWRTPDRDRRSLIDALTLTAGWPCCRGSTWSCHMRTTSACPGFRRASRSPTRSGTC